MKLVPLKLTGNERIYPDYSLFIKNITILCAKRACYSNIFVSMPRVIIELMRNLIFTVNDSGQ